MRLFSEYCGLGQSSGPAQHAVDAACKEHDEAYEEILKRNKNPYFHFNQADEDFIKRVEATVPESQRERLVQWAALKLFKFKKAVAPHSTKNLDGEKWLKEAKEMAFGQQTEKERKAARQKFLKEEALALIATGEVELDKNGKITGNKRDAVGNRKDQEDEESFPNLPAIENGDDTGELDELIDDDWFPDSDPTNGMEVDSGPGGEPVPEAARVSAGGMIGAGNVSKETQVMKNATPSYGLQETHTTLCNYTNYFSATLLDHTAPLVTEFRMTAPFDMMTGPTDMVAVGAPASYTKNLNNVPWMGTTGRVANDGVFPITPTAGAATAEKANWFAFWSKIYEYYTVLSCDYKIVINNPSTTTNNDILVGWDFNSYSDTAGATGNKTPQTSTLMDMRAYKHMKWQRVEITTGVNTARATTIISGTYVPGMANRNVSNDGDVKTWNSTGGAGPTQPTLKEFLTLYFFKAPLNYTNTGTVIAGCNVEFTLKYKVQFKDLRVNARYPTTGVTAISMITPTDVMQVSTGI